MRQECVFSKLTSKSQTVLPLSVRKTLGLKPGDMVAYRINGQSVELTRVSLDQPEDDPFFAFTEWASAADEHAFKNL